MTSRVKKIKVPIGTQDEDLSEMFNQMLGAGNVNITIAYPRYLRIKGICEQLLKLFTLLAESPFMRNPEFASEKKQIQNFCSVSKVAVEEVFSMDFSDYVWNLTLLDDDRRAAFTVSYEKMKKAEIVNTFILMCDKLVPYKKNFADLDKLNPKFITSMCGVEWRPFPFTTLNLKYIFSLGVSNSTIAFFMTVLSKSYELSRMLYDEIQSPDIDVDQFVDFIMKSIDDIQKRPELNRCREAFNKIKESVSMLKTRFNGYYRDFISTSDSTIIMQHFIIDVSKNTNASPKITQQFRTIISYYRKIASDQITNPKIKMLFDKVNASFKELERGTENLVNIRDDKKDTQLSHDEASNDSDEICVSTKAKTVEDVVCTESTDIKK